MNDKVGPRIAKTVIPESPLSYTEWAKTYKIGTRVPRYQKDCDMYVRGDYDFKKLESIIKSNKKAGSNDRVLKFETA
jgi:hypothetical protein